MKTTYKYKAFFSYSHKADGKLTRAIESCLKVFAKPWYRRRAIEIFRDESGMAMTPELWPEIEKNLEQSEQFVIFASPDAAKSRWVRREIDWWLKHRSIENIHIILTDGYIEWDYEKGRFDWNRTTSLPELLQKRYRNEPGYLDLRWADGYDHLTALNKRFRGAIRQISASLQGKTPEEVYSEESRTLRRNLYWACSAIILLITLFITAYVQRQLAIEQRDVAVEQYRRAFSRQLATQARDLLEINDLDLSLLLSIESVKQFKTAEARSALLTGLQAANPLISQLHAPQMFERPDTFYFIRHKDEVYSVAFSPDGKILAAACWDGTVRLWDTQSRQPLGDPLKASQWSVRSVAFSPDGKILAAAGDDQTVRLWDTQSRQLLDDSLKVREWEVYSVAFSPDGKILAAAGREGTVTLWDTQSRQPLGDPLKIYQREVHREVYSVAFSPDGKVLAAAGQEGTVTLWDTQSRQPLGDPLKVYQGEGYEVYSVAFSPDGKILAAAGWNGRMRMWDMQSRQPLGDPIKVHQTQVQSMAFSPDGKILAVAGKDGTVTLREMIEPLMSNRYLYPISLGDPFKTYQGLVYSVAFSPDGKTFASAGREGAVMLWNTKSRLFRGIPFNFKASQSGLYSVFKASQSALHSVAFSLDGKILVFAGEDGTVRLWDTQNRQPLGKPLKTHQGRLRSVAFSPDGKTLASAARDGTVRLWDTQSWQPLGDPLIYHYEVFSVAFSPDGKTLVSAGREGAVMLWDTQSRQPVDDPFNDYIGRVLSVAFSPDGKILAAAAYDGVVMLWDTQSRQPLGDPLKASQSALTSVAFSPDGKILAVADDYGTVRLWDTQSRQPLGDPLKASQSELNSVAFSPDGKILATAGRDGTVMLWNTQNRKSIGRPLRAYQDWKNSLAFSPDAKILAVVGSDGTVTLWDIDVTSWQKRAAQIANRKITCGEWATYMGEEPYQERSCSGSGPEKVTGRF